MGHEDEAGVETFQAFSMGRRIMRMYDEFRRRGETRTCFLRIVPDREVSTYMMGYSIWEMRRRMETGAEKVQVGS